MKNLLAIDGSIHSKAAIDAVASRSFPPKTEIRIVSVFENTPLITTLEPRDVSQEYYHEADQLAIETAEGATENAAKILRCKNLELTITTTVIEGSPKNAILKEAETFGATLIVVGSHGYGAVERFLLGSVSQAVDYTQIVR